MRVVPPPRPAEPVRVYLSDYGRHSSLIFPKDEKHLVEYTYGDWEFYALDKYRWYIGFTKLLFGGDAAMGKRVLPRANSLYELTEVTGARRVMCIEVEKQKLAGLSHELEDAYNSHINTLTYNKTQDTHFVRADERYWLMHTCNVLTGQWLEKLGCRVYGCTVMSNFAIWEPDARPTK